MMDLDVLFDSSRTFNNHIRHFMASSRRNAKHFSLLYSVIDTTDMWI